MNKRKLGRSGLEVAPLAFGGNVYGRTVDEPTSFRLLDAFAAAGFNLIVFLNERGFRILNALDQVAGQLNSTPARVSLAWLIARPGITAPIASATSLEQLDDLIEATRLELDDSSMELLNEASA